MPKYALILRKIIRSKYFYPVLFALLLLIPVFMYFQREALTTPPVMRNSIGTPFMYEVGNSKYNAKLGTKSDNSPKVEIGREGKKVDFTLKNAQKKTVVRDYNNVIFQEVDTDIDLKYTPLINGIKEELILKKRVSKSDFEFDLNLKGLKLKKTPTGDNSLILVDENNNYQFHFETPYAYDGLGKKTYAANISIKEEKGTYKMTLSVDKDWLNSKSRSYPVYIDPTIVHDTTAEFATGSSNRVKDIGSGSSPILETFYQEANNDPYVLGLWHMNEGTDNTCTGGQDVCDKSGNAAEGTFVGNAAFTSNARLGSYGTTFDGTGDYISAGDIEAIDKAQTLSACAWVDHDQITADAGILSKSNITNDGVYFFRDDVGSISPRTDTYTIFIADSADADTTRVEGATGISLVDTWTHVCFTFEAGKTNGLRLYINGKEDPNSPASTSIISAIDSTTNPFIIGARGDGTSGHDGEIDEVIVSGEVFSAEKISALASRRPYSTYTSDIFDVSTSVLSWNPLSWTELGVNTGNGETLKNSSGLVAQWNFNETSGTTADNAQGTATHDGTLTNFTSTGSQDAAAGTGWTSDNKRWGAGALMFDGSNDYVSITDSAAWDFASNDFAFEYWVKMNTLDDIGYFGQSNGGGNNFKWGVYWNTIAANKLTFHNNTNTGTITNISWDWIPTVGKWQHIVITRNGNNWYLYVDGDPINSPQSSSLSVANASANPRIGSDGEAWKFLNGTMDSFRLYSRALSAAEIMSNYQVGNIEFQTRVGSDTSPDDGSWEEWRPATNETQIISENTHLTDSLISYWKLDEATGTRFDSWGKNNLTSNGTGGVTSVTGKMNAAGDFETGESDFLEITDNASLSTGDIDFTVSMWANLESKTASQTVIAGKDDAESGGAAEWKVGYSGTGSDRFFIQLMNGASGYPCTAFANNLGSPTLSTTYFIVAWHDATANTCNIQVNNGTVDSAAESGVITDSTASFRIGAITTVEANFFDGIVDEVGFWKRTLNSTERSTLYDSGYPKHYPDETNINNLEPHGGIRTTTDSTIKVEGSGSQKIENGKVQVDGSTVGLWRMDETGGTGAYLKDSSANASNGTPTGTTTTQGVVGKARSFNGSSNYISIPATASLDVQNVTIEAWINSANFAQDGFIFEKTTNGTVNTQYSCFFSAVSGIFFRTYNTVPTMDDLTVNLPNTGIVNGRWNHLACVYDGTQKIIYVNGVAVGSKPYNQTLRTNPAGTSTIGAHGAVSSYFFNGKIDEVRVSNVGRSAEEIAEIYRMGRDHYINKTISASVDLSGESTLPFYIAADRPGSYLSATTAESNALANQSSSQSLAFWHLDEQSGTADYFKDFAGNSHGRQAPLTYGTGLDGTCTVASGTTNINTASCTGKATADAVNFSVTANTAAGQNQITLSTTPTGLAKNDEVLIINLQGASGNFANVGQYELRTITNISGNTLTLETALNYGYDGTTQKIMVQRVPNYRNVTVSLGATLTGQTWNGTKNGVMFFKANGTVTIAGSIDMGGRGYTGGAARPAGDLLGNQGDSIKTGVNAGGANQTAGGGGLAHNNGVCNPSAGGGGGYGTAGATSTNKTNSCAGGGIGGGTNGATTLATLFFGGGGGSGGNKTNGGGTSGAGGVGGGILGIYANSLTVTGSITANGSGGSAPSCTTDSCGDGGGGGAGGSILIYSSTATLGTNLITSVGGGGNTSGSHSNGGNGGVGRVAIYYVTAPTGSTNPAATTAATNFSTGAVYTQGKVGKARAFNGLTDYILVPAATGALDVDSGALSIEAWINTNDIANSRTIFARGFQGTNGYGLRINSTGKINLGYHGGSNFDGATTLIVGKWYHVVGVINGASSAIYLNGALDGTGTVSIVASDLDARIGASWDNTTKLPLYFWSGSIDEVRISNVARTADNARQTYEMGARTHNITIDFGASLDSGNLITGSGDTSFTVDATTRGLNNKGSNLYKGDKIIVRENYDGTEYIAQGTVTGNNLSTGATTVATWDAGSTFPSGGFTVNADVFKWQREYWNIDGGVQDTSLNAIYNFTLRVTDGTEGRTIWLDDLKSNSNYLTTPGGSTITSSTGNRYLQYRAIQTTSDIKNSSQLTNVTLDYAANTPPLTPTLISPSNNSTGNGKPVVMTMSSTDPDSDYLRYKIEICENAEMTNNCLTIDQTSSQTGWSGQNAQTSTAYTSGTTATYSTSALIDGHTYHWRAYAIDPGGTNSWTSTQTPILFVTNALTRGNTSSALTVYSSVRVAEFPTATFGWSNITGVVDGATTASTNGWVDSSNLVAGRKYLLMLSGSHSTDDISGKSGLRLTHGGITFESSENVDETINTNAAYKKPSFWFTVWTAVDGEDLEVQQYWNGSGTQARAEDITLVAIDAQSLIDSGNLKYTENSTYTALTTSLADMATLTFTPAVAGKAWWIMGYNHTSQNTAAIKFENDLLVNGVTVGQNQLTTPLNEVSPVVTLGTATTLTNTAQTIKVQAKQVGTGAIVQATGIFALNLSVFEDYVATYKSTGTTMNSVGSWVTQTTLKPLNSYNTSDWFVAGGSRVEGGNSEMIISRLQESGVSITDDIGPGVGGTGDKAPRILFDYYQNLPAGLKTFNYDTQIATGTSAVSIHNWSIAFSRELIPNYTNQNLPTDGNASVPSRPTFRLTDIDPDSNYLRYKIVICTNSAMTTGCQTHDQTASQSGWNGQNTQANTAYTSGTQTTFVQTSDLTPGQTYYWKAYSKDPAGTNTWTTENPNPWSFTVSLAPTAPSNPWVEGSSAPTAVTDLTPEFSAIHNDPEGDSSASYQIQVNTASDFSGTSMWDSGKHAITVANNARSADVSYAGTALGLTGTTYYFRIRFWDINDTVGTWSTVSQFTMKGIEMASSCHLVKSQDSSSLTLKWKDNTSLEDGYKVQRKVDGGSWTDLATKLANSITHSDSTISFGHTYQYRVAPTNAGVTGAYCTTDIASVFQGSVKFEGIKLDGIQIF